MHVYFVCVHEQSEVRFCGIRSEFNGKIVCVSSALNNSIDLSTNAHMHTNALNFTKASDIETSNRRTKSKQGL